MRYSIYLVRWYKSTNTDAGGSVQRKNYEPNSVKTSCKTENIDKEVRLICAFDSVENEPKSTRILRYPQFTCFISTNVQILTPQKLLDPQLDPHLRSIF